MIDLQGRTALVIGGINQVAAGIAAALKNAGASVVLGYHADDTERAARIAAEVGLQAHAYTFDDAAQMTEQLASLTDLHIAVICPRWYRVGKFMDTTPADWDDAVSTNYEQLLYIGQAVARSMVNRGSGGRIIFLSSVSAMMPFSDTSAVGTTLAMLHPLAKMAAVDLGAHGITVNVVALGWIESEFYAPYLHDEGRAYVERGIPLGHVGTPDDVGKACCFLASDLASYITGAVLPVDGGYILTRSPGGTPYPPHDRL